MHQKWIASMDYFKIPEEQRQDFYDWYCKEYPDNLCPVSRAYEEFQQKDLLIHSAQLVDGYPLCAPVETWEGILYKTTNEDSKVTCGNCKDIIEQMNREIYT